MVNDTDIADKIDILTCIGALAFSVLLMFALKQNGSMSMYVFLGASIIAGAITLKMCMTTQRNWLGRPLGPIFGLFFGLIPGSITVLMDHKAQDGPILIAGALALIVGVVLFAMYLKNYYYKDKGNIA